MWKLSISTTSNLSADGIVRMVDRTSFGEDPTLTGAPRGKNVTLRSENPATLMGIVARLQRELERGSVTKITITKEQS